MITIISGSHRKNSQSSKVARHIQGVLTGQMGLEADLIDLAGNPLPLWDDSYWQDGSDLKNKFAPYANRLKAADAFVLVSPEWAGMAAPGLKNFLLYCSPNEMGHKPALIVTVSAARGGAYPVAELRGSSYKNIFLTYIPDHVIVRDVGDVLNDPAKSASKDDDYIRERIAYSLKILGEYAGALKAVRESGLIDYKTYPFGM